MVPKVPDHRRFKATLVANAQDPLVLGATCDRALRIFHGQAQGFFAKNVLARLGSRHDLIGVLLMRGAQNDRFHVCDLQKIFETGQHLHALQHGVRRHLLAQLGTHLHHRHQGHVR